jgi:hypothetical protein
VIIRISYLYTLVTNLPFRMVLNYGFKLIIDLLPMIREGPELYLYYISNIRRLYIAGIAQLVRACGC